jgi:magnesium transporter
MAKKKTHKRKSKMGLPPGSFVFTGHQKVEHVRLTLIQYNQEKHSEQVFTDLNEALLAIDAAENQVSWLNVTGIHNVELIEEICKHFEIHRLTGEDIVSVGQRPKLDEFDNYLHLVLRMFHIETQNLDTEQVTFILRNRVLLTFQEREGDVFDYIRKRLEEGKGTIRARSADYLLYALLDAIVDSYFTILEQVGEQLEDLEVEMLKHPTEHVLTKLHDIRKDALLLRRSVYPLREVVSKLEKIEEPLFAAEHRVFVRDLYDHTIQAIETIEVFRDMASGMLDLYMNSLSNRMNNVMKVLTIIATIFIPLTFIVGIYGMNFEFMPELGHPWAYPAVMILMLGIAVAMVVYFKVKKWF